MEWAGCGVICMDEFDKLATSRSDSRFAGQQTTKDVSGFGVQRSLLHLLSAPRADFPPDFGFTSRTPLRCPWRCRRSPSSPAAPSAAQGHGGGPGGHDGARWASAASRARAAETAIATRMTEEQLEQTTAFARYGFIPELIGRFNRLVSFSPLDSATLGRHPRGQRAAQR